MALDAITKSDQLLVDVSADEMTATVRLRRSTDGATGDEVLEALRAAGVEIDDAVVKRVDAFVGIVEEKKAATEPFIVANGCSAEDAVDETFVWAESHHAEAAEWAEDAPVDFYTFNSILTVEVDALIGSIAPGVPARHGVTVRGEKLEGNGVPKKLKLHETLTRNPEDPTKIISRVAGRVAVLQNILKIDEVVEIPGDIGFDTGNIDTHVDVHIKGKVTELFEVKTARSMSVGASIEAAKVIAGRDVVVRRGVVGRHAGVVMAGGDIITKHASEANLVALGDIKVGKQLMNSHVCVSGTLDAECAAVIGGSLYAGRLVAVKNLGSEANIPTRIVAGVRPEFVRELAMIQRRIERTRNAVQKITDLIQPLLDGSREIDRDRKARSEALIAQADEVASGLTDVEKRKEELIAGIYPEENAAVKVSGVIHTNVIVRVGDRETQFRKELKGPVSIEKRKIKNVTQLVAVNQLSGSVTVLNGERCTPEELLDGFEIEKRPEENL